MSALATFCAGAALGLSIAAPVGPMGLLCIDRTLNGGVWAGVSTGAGAATVQVVYCACLLFSIDLVGPWLDTNRASFGLLGAGLMLLFAVRLLRPRRPPAGRRPFSKRSLLTSYATAALFNCTNPMMILLMLGGLASVAGPSAAQPADAAPLLAGLFAGAIAWWISLSGATAMLSGRMSLRAMSLVDKATASLLLGFSVMAARQAFG